MTTFALSELTVAFVAEHAPAIAEALRAEGAKTAEESVAKRVEEALEAKVAEARAEWEVGETANVQTAVDAERERTAGILGAAFEGQTELAAKLINEGTPLAEALKALIDDAHKEGGSARPLALVKATEPTNPPAAGDPSASGEDGDALEFFRGAAAGAGVEVHGK